jgi:hypothetical protein
MPTHKLTPEIIQAAIEGFQQSKLRIDAQIAELRAMLPGGRTEPVVTLEAPTGKRRKISAAARKRMKEGQQRRWAKIRGEAESPSSAVTPEPAKPKRKLSAAGKAAIVATLKKRWAAKKAAPVVAKKAAVKKAVAQKAAKKAVKVPETAATPAVK